MKTNKPTSMKTRLILTCFMLLLAFNFNGQTVTLTLNNIPENILCNEIWTEQNLNMSLVETTADDCIAGSGSCYFGFMNQAFNSFPLWLYPSRLTIDLSSLQNVQMVEVDIYDNCGFYCTQAFLMENTEIISSKGNSLSIESETLILENPTQEFLTELAISSCEGAINEIRIYQNTSSINNESSGVKKVLRTIDQLGREVNHSNHKLLFYIYDDGSVEKKFVVE
jgi:hypothetical protein